ncbi:hypothetical protein BDB01DRAFT_323128 [Pilobolus umbonatus]|nr:hypothetical protein BDB01DRAFT_323128 [Pilobolus umbonatus]
MMHCHCCIQKRTIIRKGRKSQITNPIYNRTQGITLSEYRYTFHQSTSTLHTKDLIELIPTLNTVATDKRSQGNALKDHFFWMDIEDPTDTELKYLQDIFNIHPLIIEDIATEEQREKCDRFKDYFFISFRTFRSNPYSVQYPQPVGLYILLFKEYILTFHYGSMSHPANVRKRISHLKGYLTVTPDWICYSLLDDITDSFAPLIHSIEFEVDSIDELVLVLKESEQSDMLRRIGYCRKRIMSLLRLLIAKTDVIKTLIKRGEGIDSVEGLVNKEIILYLGDVQDHIITMLQSLNHYEKISSRSHSNYLAQISIEMTQTNNDINDILSKITALGSIIIPMNLVTGLWGMNVQVPGQYQEDLIWFFSILGSILAFCIMSIIMMKIYKII